MAEKAIELLKEQLGRLDDPKIDIDVWKNQTIIYLERIFGVGSNKVKIVREIRNDYSSWNLRDTTGTEKSKDPAKTKAREIIEAIIHELEILGPPSESRINDTLWKFLEDELTGKQIKEIEMVLKSDTPEKTKKIQEILEKIGHQGLTSIIARLLQS